MRSSEVENAESSEVGIAGLAEVKVAGLAGVETIRPAEVRNAGLSGVETEGSSGVGVGSIRRCVSSLGWVRGRADCGPPPDNGMEPQPNRR